MEEYPRDIKFKYSWRKYQQRVLDELDEHLSDDHLHIVAPPGSGKTILGLEVAIRLNKPTLILAPTIAIRNQWIQRFCELFLQINTTPDWISRDIRNPKFLTVVTYQGLHAACNNLRGQIEANDEQDESIKLKNDTSNQKFDAIIKGLKSQKIKTIVVDEAHHLKNDWWQTLTKVKEELVPIILGLTATPPYDVTPNEWKRYLDLNGPVDTEISVPELIIEGDLCPHQDYVHFTLPTDEENESILEFRKNIEKLFHEIKEDKIIVEAIENHPIWLNPTQHLDWIYSNISYYSACLIFLNANQREISKDHIEIIGDKKNDIPTLDYNWLETILDFYLYKEKVHFKLFVEHQEKLENKLRRYGAIEKKRIDFTHNKRVNGFLTSSISKLKGIKEIVDFEYKQLRQNLRMVILSDYIRKEFFINAPENTLELNKIGIIPIFEKLRRNNTDQKKIGVLTGSIIIIPSTAFPLFSKLAQEIGIVNINSSLVPYDEKYVLIHPSEQLKNSIIKLITQIFQEGEIEILIGTKSLLGEGWDAPAINSLVMASFVGSFVLSNQMRGRAIRTQKGNLGKTSNIWHLATIDQTADNGGDDFEVLKRRFRSFVGVSFKDKPGIENGIGRLNIPANIHLKEELEKKNEEMFAFAGDRESLAKRWKTALDSGNILIEEIKIPFSEKRKYNSVKSLYLNKTIANLVATLVSGIFAFGGQSLEILGQILRHLNTSQVVFYLSVIGIVGTFIFGRLTLKTLRLFLKYRDISKDIQQIGVALVNSLREAKIVNTVSSALKVNSSIDEWGSVYCHLEGATTFEKSTFISSLQEIISPIDNPRYVIIRKNSFMLLLEKKDYHSVPEVLGKNKRLAEHFESQWSKHVGKCELIFTRTIMGRKALLKSRAKALASQFEDKIEHVNKWR